jgi:hypothetical protein
MRRGWGWGDHDSNLSSRFEGPSLRWIRVLKDRLGDYARPKGRSEPFRARAFAEPAPFAALRAGFQSPDPVSSPRFHLSSRSDDPTRRVRRALKGRLGYYARPEGRDEPAFRTRGSAM